MLEQSFYEPEYIPAEPVPEDHEPEIFENYEIKSWQLSPRIYKILGASAVFNVVALLIFGQTSLLSMKGCDSPLVGGVCKVLDTVYVGAVLFGTDREYVDAEYERTELADADVTFVDVTGVEPQISYPAGYFQIANPEEFAALQAQAEDPSKFLAPGIPAYPGISPTVPPMRQGGLLDTRPNLPKSNPNAIDGDLPDGIDDATTARTPPLKNRRPGKITQGNANTGANADGSIPGIPNSVGKGNTANSNTDGDVSDVLTSVKIDKEPLNLFADTVLAKWSMKEIDLSQEFTVFLNATIDADGHFDKARSKWDPTREKGDPKMIEIARHAVEAVGDSGWLGYLRVLDISKVSFEMVQDGENLYAVVISPQQSDAMAKTKASQVGASISLGKMSAKQDSDEMTLLNSASVSPEGKNVVIRFNIAKPIAQEMINRKLQEQLAKKRQTSQPSGVAPVNSGNNSSTR